MHSVLRKEWSKAVAGGGGLPPCDRCGWGGDDGEPDDFGPDDTFEIVFADEPEEEFCPECGRQVNVVVRFGL